MIHTQGKIVITKYRNSVVSLVYDEENIVTDIFCEPENYENLPGNIYLGRVVRTVPSLNAAFIEFAEGTEGYFSIEDNKTVIYADRGRIRLPLKGEDRVIVRISRDAKGSKKPVLSCDITLPGKYVVFTANRPGLRFSSEFKNPEKKAEIKSGFYGREYGFIVRTNALDADTDAVFAEMDYFISLWEEILKNAAAGRAPGLLYRAPEAFLSCIRECGDAGIKKIITDIPEVYEKINSYMVFCPEAVRNKPELYKNKTIPFDLLYGVSRNMEDALKEKVYLKSGAYLVIEHTEALVSIDVNSGQAVSKKDSQVQFLKINTEAAKEAARQIRLRNLSGIIIIDFINMKSSENNNILMKKLKEFLADDPLKPDLVDMTGLGLVEITRKKSLRPLYELADI